MVQAQALPKEEIARLVSSVPTWFHSLDFGAGVVSQGHKSREQLAKEWRQINLPDLRGMTVLDINSWDGFFAFEAEKHGAGAVTALDFYMWAMELGEHSRYWRECLERNVAPKPYHEMPYYQPNELPGKRGFDTARRIFNSRVNDIVGDFMTMELEPLGKFDIVLFLGTLYHMKDPLGSIERLAAVTKRLAVIETEAIDVVDHRDRALCEFFPSNELNGDVSNWWAPNLPALIGMCRAAGFARVDVQVGEPPSRRSLLPHRMIKRLISKNGQVRRYRAVVHAWKEF